MNYTRLNSLTNVTWSLEKKQLVPQSLVVNRVRGTPTVFTKSAE